jgi:hypothetical protein
MRVNFRRNMIGLSVVLVFLTFAMDSASAVTPNPVLIFSGQEPFTTGGTNFIRYRYSVFNLDQFPNELFAPAPALPPCGANTNSSRSWVDLFDQRGKRLNGFCALGNNSNLNAIWFALPETEVPPSWIFIEITDRQTETKVKSNLAETTM